MGAGGGKRGGRRGLGREGGGALAKLLVFLVVVAAFAALAWMLFLPSVLTARLRERTGFEATVERLVVNPFSGDIDLRGLVLRNPAEFPVREFVEIKALRANLRVRSLFSARTEFDAMTIEIGAITLVKGRDGAINAEVFEANTAARTAAGSARRSFLVRELRLRVDRLVVADHSRREPEVQEHALGVEQVYAEVTDLEQVLTTAALRPLVPVATVVLGLVPGELGTSLDQAAKSGAGFLKEAGRKTGEGVKGFFDALEESKKP